MTPECKRKIIAEWECNYAFQLMKALDANLEGMIAKKTAAMWATEIMLNEYKEVINEYIKTKFKGE